jgi:hypothetical protein
VACLRLVDLSAAGAGLLLSGPVGVGEGLLLTLQTPLGLHRQQPLLRVTHCAGAGGGHFLVGGAFAAPLGPDVCRLLLG